MQRCFSEILVHTGNYSMKNYIEKVAFFLRLFSQKLIKRVLVDVGLRLLCVRHRGLQNQVY